MAVIKTQYIPCMYCNAEELLEVSQFTVLAMTSSLQHNTCVTHNMSCCHRSSII